MTLLPAIAIAIALALALVFAFVRASALVALLRPTSQRRSCAPGEHLVTVHGTRRLRHALRKRQTIRCLMCDVELGPYDSWHVAWTEVFRMRMDARRGVSPHEPIRLPSDEVSR
jgi:hypothetical protein